MSSEFYEPRALFVLEPLNETACELLKDPHNKPWIGTTKDGAVGFEIGGNCLSSSDDPLTCRSWLFPASTYLSPRRSRD